MELSQCYVLARIRGEFGREEWIHLHVWFESLHSSCETTTTLLTDYIPIKNRKFKVCGKKENVGHWDLLLSVILKLRKKYSKERKLER